MKRNLTKVLLLAGCLLSGVLMSGCTGKAQANEKEFATGDTVELTFITIGKGDAFLIKTPQNTYYMYDTGKKEDYEQIKQVLETKHVSEFKGIFLSHGHKDHAGNVKHIIKEYPVETIYLSEKDEASYEKTDIRELAEKYQVRELAEKYQVSLQYLKGGETLNLEGVTADIWIPERCDFRNSNNNSVVIRFAYGQNSFLMTGDMEYGEEAAYLQSGVAEKTDILKLGHHGEKDATSVALLEKIQPAYGLITGNEEENPDSVNPEITARLEAFDVEAFYSENKQLAWDFIMDGSQIQIEKLTE